MSLSVADMLKSLTAAQTPPKEGKMNNPDIPVRGSQKNGREVTRDTFYRSMKLTGSARNGSGYSLARSGGIPNLNPRRQEFMLEGAIDPANIRARHNPGRAPPNSFAQGAEGFGYALPTAPAHSELSQSREQAPARSSSCPSGTGAILISKVLVIFPKPFIPPAASRA